MEIKGAARCSVKKSALLLIVALTAVIGLVGCGSSGGGIDDSPDQQTDNISITPETSFLVSGETVTLIATVNGVSNTEVTWTSNGGIFLPKGNTATFVAPIKSGSYKVTATSVVDNQLSASAIVNVEIPLPEQQLVFITDQSAMASSIGDQVRYEVQLIGTDDTVVDEGEVSWTSADTSVATVVQDGSRAALVTVQTQSITSTTITARIGDIEASATILITKPSNGTVLISSAVVKSSSENTVTLERNSLTETLTPGQRLVSGNRAGVLVSILSVELTNDEVRLTTELSSLVDAFDALSVSATGTPVNITVQMVDPNVAIVQAFSLGMLTTQLVLEDVPCKTENDVLVGLDLKESSVLLNSNYFAKADIEITFENGLEQFAFKNGAILGVYADAGEIDFTIPVSGKVECSIELPPIRAGILPVTVFTFSPILTPILGVEVEALAAASSFALSGPQGTVSASLEAGIEYTNAAGWAPVSSFTFDGNFEPFSSSRLSDQSFSSKIAPFGQLDVGLLVDLGLVFFEINLVDARFAELKGYGLLDFDLPNPSDEVDASYLGPNWSVGFGTSGALKAELQGGVLDDFLSLLGIPTLSVQLELFNESTVLTKSLSLTSTATPAVVEEEQSVALRAVTDGNESGSVEFLGSKNGSTTLALLASATMTEGIAETSWIPAVGTTGEYEIVAHLTSEFPSNVKPYSSNSISLVMVNAKPDVPPDSSLPPGTGPLGEEGPWKGSMLYGISGTSCDDTGFYLNISFTEDPDGSLTGVYLGKHFNDINDSIEPIVGESGTLSGQRTGETITFSLAGDLTGNFSGTRSFLGPTYRLGGLFNNANVCTDNGTNVSNGLFILVGSTPPSDDTGSGGGGGFPGEEETIP